MVYLNSDNIWNLTRIIKLISYFSCIKEELSSSVLLDSLERN